MAVGDALERRDDLLALALHQTFALTGRHARVELHASRRPRPGCTGRAGSPRWCRFRYRRGSRNSRRDRVRAAAENSCRAPAARAVCWRPVAAGRRSVGGSSRAPPARVACFGRGARGRGWEGLKAGRRRGGRRRTHHRRGGAAPRLRAEPWGLVWVRRTTGAAQGESSETREPEAVVVCRLHLHLNRHLKLPYISIFYSTSVRRCGARCEE